MTLFLVDIFETRFLYSCLVLFHSAEQLEPFPCGQLLPYYRKLSKHKQTKKVFLVCFVNSQYLKSHYSHFKVDIEVVSVYTLFVDYKSDSASPLFHSWHSSHTWKDIDIIAMNRFISTIKLIAVYVATVISAVRLFTAASAS